uniref:Uncharacterized protein n=1 Tax=Candidatus Kentrum sp. UNK TaxID=2126344 RepID=A0A451B659_9GAMM|nr:MAG: hypothetical protein BECKUNK1418G_GA0071005_12982 [Candidatus Kentron sp. UNK]VFK73769.1 MAG: hypothetical protein BECKUNK1418H_GA0071006_12842 [Candidatus Kentron sp. UNK]
MSSAHRRPTMTNAIRLPATNRSLLHAPFQQRQESIDSCEKQSKHIAVRNTRRPIPSIGPRLASRVLPRDVDRNLRYCRVVSQVWAWTPPATRAKFRTVSWAKIMDTLRSGVPDQATDRRRHSEARVANSPALGFGELRDDRLGSPLRRWSCHRWVGRLRRGSNCFSR